MSQQPNDLNQVRIDNPRRLIVFAVLMAVITLVLLFWARQVIHEVFVLPLSYLWWSIKTMLIIVPEIYQWLAVVAISVLIAYRALAGKPKKVAPAPPLLAELDYEQQGTYGRVSYWANKINLIHAGSSAYYQTTFHNVLGRLLVDLLAHRYHLTPNQVEQRLREDPASEQVMPIGNSLPADVREYVLFSLQRGDFNGSSRWGLLLRRIREVVQALFKPKPRNEILTARAALEPRLARVIQYMEEELEVPNDDSGR